MTRRRAIWACAPHAGQLAGTGPEITDYDVQYRVKDSGDFLPWPYSGAELDATITGLERDTAYEVQVRATNDEGTSDWSPSGQATTHNAAPLPDTRRILADIVSAVGGAVEIVDLSRTFREPDNDGIGFAASSEQFGGGLGDAETIPPRNQSGKCGHRDDHRHRKRSVRRVRHPHLQGDRAVRRPSHPHHRPSAAIL